MTAVPDILFNLPDAVLVVVVAMLPIFELRGAIPLAMGVFHMSFAQSFLLAVLGNMIPVLPLLLFLDPVSNWLRRFRSFDRFFNWLFARTRRRGEKVMKYETLGLILFVAVPLPITGAWTGCATAFVFGVRFQRAFLSIFTGVLIAGTIVSALTIGIIGTG